MQLYRDLLITLSMDQPLNLFSRKKDYDKKLEKAYKEYEENLKTQDIESIQPFIDLANNLTSEVAEAYTAIGLKAGFLILFDILKELEK